MWRKTLTSRAREKDVTRVCGLCGPLATFSLSADTNHTVFGFLRAHTARRRPLRTNAARYASHERIPRLPAGGPRHGAGSSAASAGSDERPAARQVLLSLCLLFAGIDVLQDLSDRQFVLFCTLYIYWQACRASLRPCGEESVEISGFLARTVLVSFLILAPRVFGHQQESVGRRGVDEPQGAHRPACRAVVCKGWLGARLLQRGVLVPECSTAGILFASIDACE